MSDMVDPIPSPPSSMENDDDDDDDMADLFSFGGVTTTITAPTDSTDVVDSDPQQRHHQQQESAIVHADNVTRTTVENEGITLKEGQKGPNSNSLFGALPAFLAQRTIPPKKKPNNDEDTTSTDSFLELLEQESKRNNLYHNSDDDGSSNGLTNGQRNSSLNNIPVTELDTATKDILNWLQSENESKSNSPILSSKSFQPPLPPPPPAVPTQPTVVALPPIYATLQDALLSSDATKQQIRDLFHKEHDNNSIVNDDLDPMTVILGRAATSTTTATTTIRAELYCRMICHNKSLQTIFDGSLADSYNQWKQASVIQREQQLVNLENCTSQEQQQKEQYVQWIRQQQIAQRIASTTHRPVLECEEDLIDLVLYHHQSTFRTSSNENTISSGSAVTSDTVGANGTNDVQSVNNNNNSNANIVRNDILLPMVASTLLAANIPVSVAAVVLSHIIPSFIPLLGLPPATERWEAALFLHSEFYLLACYHIPLLVIHLDKYIPGWYWPKLPQRSASDDDLEMNDKENVGGRNGDSTAVQIGRNLKKQGQVPLSWLVSHLSGECDGTSLPIELVLSLWDQILTGQQNNSATRFFLTLSVLERQAATLLLLTGDELVHALQSVWTLENIDEHKEPNEKEWKYEWWPQALELQLSTPESVLERLQLVEDQAFQHAIKRKQERAEALLQERLEVEAAAYREAQELKAEEARVRLSRARLVAFYRKHAPDKESNIEQIMETYKGRLDVLDSKLKDKYGEGFNPAVKAKPPPPPKSNLIAKMQQRLKREKSGIDEDLLDTAMEERKPLQVSVFVSAEEVLPVICWSKEATAARGLDQSRRRKMTRKKRSALKFYLIDCRTEEAVQEQGRFPTAFRLSPETLHDPEKLQEHEDTLESFRGAVHLVIMGEGFNSIPNLYNQKLSPKLQELMEQDEARTNLCALFFQKRGFCFVSLLTGGFCAAHSWLVREGPKHHLNVSSVLVDYNPEMTLFGQLETLHNASMTEKAQRKMASLLEASMVTVTKRAIQLERLTTELNDNKDGQRQGFRKLFGRTDASSSNIAYGVENQIPNNSSSDKSNSEKSTASTFQNPFASISKRDEKTDNSKEAPSNTNPIKSDASNFQFTGGAPTTSTVDATSPNPPPLPPPPPSSNSPASTSTTNKFGKFFQQTSEVVGVATTAAVAAATTAATTTKIGLVGGVATDNTFSSNNDKVKDDGATTNNRFKGFGAALQQTRARFGTTTQPPPPSSSSIASITATSITANTGPETSTTTSGGFNFNSFRKSAMSRVLNQQQHQQTTTTTPTTHPDNEEAEVKFV